MIAAWMIYTMAVGFLLYAAAMGAEYVSRSVRLPTRVAWMLAMTAAVALSGNALLGGGKASRPAPIASSRARSIRIEAPASITDRRTSFGSATLPPSTEHHASFAAATVETSVARFRTIEHSVGGSISRIDVSAFDRWNPALIVAWAGSSALTMVWLLVSLLRLRRLARRLTPGTVASRAVLVSEDVGPALLGILRTRIVLPRWVLELPPAEQEIIVAHERQHAAAFDPGLVCASMCIVAIQPWNPALWMLLARLRLAVEADCDGRVLGEGCDARAYGQLLVEMYERTSGLSPHVAFAERPSNLERRIRRIASRPRLFSAAVGASAIAATVFATAAWTTSAPTRTTPLLSPAISAIAILRGLVPGATAAPMPSAGSADPVPRSGATEPVREDPQAIVHFDSRAAEPETVTFRQIVIAANDANDVTRTARLADSVGDLLRHGAPFDSLAKRFHDYSIGELTTDLTPWPVDAMPSYYRKGVAGAHAGDIVVFEVTGLRRPRFVVAQLLTVQPGEPHQGLAQRIDPISGLAEAVPAAAMLAQTSSIRVTVESPNHAQYRLAVPQDSAMRPVLLRGRAVSELGAPAGPDAPYSVMEVMSLDSTSQIHVEAARNGHVIASGEGAYLLLRRDSVGVTIEAWSHVPPSRPEGLGKLSRTAITTDAETAAVVLNEERRRAPTGPCATPDSIAIRGLSRLRDTDVRSELGIAPKSTISGPVVTQALRNLYATNSIEPNAAATCEVMGGKNVLVFNVKERRISVADSDLVRVGYVTRKETATGFFVDSSDIDRHSPLFSDAVRAVPGLRVTPAATHIDPVTGRPLDRTNVITSASGGCVTTFVDGVAFKPMAPGDIDDYVSAGQLIAIELYQPLNTPPQFVRRDEPSCSALLVWTQALRRRRR